MNKTKVIVIAASTLAMAAALVPAFSADNLELARDVSFNTDAGNRFPLIGQNLSDAKVEPGRSTLIFFGAGGDYNTSRQAKRLVDLYKKERGGSTKFIVVDVDHPLNNDAVALVKSYYSGYVPSQLLLDRSGQPVWRRVGEVSNSEVLAKINNHP